MRNLAGGSGFLGTIALSAAFLFYFQPTVEAVASANESEQNLTQQFNQTEQIQAQNPIENLQSQIIRTGAVTMSFRATAYCLQGRTAMGGSVRRGIVAADPRVLPLGTRIELNAGSYSGTYTVADTGGSVRGRKLDIWVPSCSEARRFGSKTVAVNRLSRNN